MNQPSLYQRANNLQRRDAREIIKEFQYSIQWRLDGHDTLLDIGCGSGDVTVDYILPIMPKNFGKIIGGDISEQMIRHATDNYQNSKISFVQMDICGDLNELEESIGGKVDHITSFYCLHWIQDQKKAVNNIFNLLNPDGDCLLVFLAGNKIYDVYKRLASIPRWEPYMEDLDRFINPYNYSEHPADEFGELFYSAGFSEFSVEVRNKKYTYEGIDILKKCVKAVNPFIDRMPHEIRDQYLDDFIAEVSTLPLCEKIKPNNDLRFHNDYKLMIAYGRK